VPLTGAYVHSLSVGASRGIVPAVRRRSVLGSQWLSERHFSGARFRFVVRDIAKGLERAASTVSREVARHGGRPEYRPMTQISEPGTRPCGQAVPSCHSCEVAEDGCE